MVTYLAPHNGTCTCITKEKMSSKTHTKSRQEHVVSSSTLLVQLNHSNMTRLAIKENCIIVSLFDVLLLVKNLLNLNTMHMDIK